MSSTLGCLGLAVEDVSALDAMLGRLLPDAAAIARDVGLEARRWTDPSGASLTITMQGDDVVDLVPSYVRAGAVTARLGGLAPHGRYVAADVLEDGEVVTRIAADLAQSLIGVVADEMDAHVTALALDVSVHADADAFGASDASLLGDPEEGKDPVRFAAESLLPWGLFGEPEEAEPMAFLAGTVLECETRVNGETGRRFHSARVRTVGFEATVCFDAEDHPVAPVGGNVVAGACYLVVDVPDL